MKRQVVILQIKCNPGICNNECINSCPVNKTKVRKTKNKAETWAIKFKESTGKPVIHEKRCLHDRCAICVKACPIEAITTVNIPDAVDEEEPVHYYTDSTFKLYRLPQISTNRIVGLLGENAIGKSTVMEILAGNIIPNGGDPESKNLKEFLRNFNIPGISRYLENVYSREMKIGYKKQDLLSFIKQNGNRTVKEVLEFTGNHTELDYYINYLDLKELLNKKVKILSGGELQRTAIASTFLTNCDIYLVDEPCTYLDVKQRLKLREIFVKQIIQNKSVIVVEHDIAILDYLSDYINILFGSPHVFGMVSRAIATKKGINSFLNGFLADENISIRSKPINFRKTAKERKFDGTTIKKISYDKYTIKIGEFTLNVNEGSIYQGEVLIILGENGLGKTTFAHSLIEILQRESTRFQFEFNDISIKEQILSRNFNGTVDQFLFEKTHKYLRNPDDKMHLLQPLGIWKLLDKQIKELSGGELQRVHIAGCLGLDADIYILDEPSAFLDSIERHKITSVIRNIAEKKRNKPIIAIEHDLQVADILGDRVLLFDGIPGHQGFTEGPFGKRDGMNRFLKNLGVTFRRDAETGRARINKPQSKIDREQQDIGEYYYTR
ncbi:MAG: ribosome biogenesis/translation initiation ATPase RLI [Candidatus Thorarchaeota archaeon]